MKARTFEISALTSWARATRETDAAAAAEEAGGVAVAGAVMFGTMKVLLGEDPCGTAATLDAAQRLARRFLDRVGAIF